jgi:hypothetical protein
LYWSFTDLPYLAECCFNRIRQYNKEGLRELVLPGKFRFQSNCSSFASEIISNSRLHEVKFFKTKHLNKKPNSTVTACPHVCTLWPSSVKSYIKKYCCSLQACFSLFQNRIKIRNILQESVQAFLCLTRWILTEEQNDINKFCKQEQYKYVIYCVTFPEILQFLEYLIRKNAPKSLAIEYVS